jgi:hypothetical protein
MNTNWSSPKRNIIAGMLDLRSALAAGQNAILVKAFNEDCSYPIKEKIHDEDYRNYEFQSGYLSTRREICEDPNMDDFHKYLTLNFKTCYGTQEAVNRYYETGLLSKDNFKGMGVSHLVNIEDLIAFYNVIGNTELAELYRSQYYDDQTGDERHFFDFYRYKHGSPWAIKKFKNKLWVIELLGKDKPKAKIPFMVKVLNVVLHPLKYIPRRSVLRMPQYTNYTFRVGDVVNGFSIEFQIPKKFSFN